MALFQPVQMSTLSIVPLIKPILDTSFHFHAMLSFKTCSDPLSASGYLFPIHSPACPELDEESLSKEVDYRGFWKAPERPFILRQTTRLSANSGWLRFATPM
jgi:hypothetical protein